jgi:hypothetical protein
MRMRVPLARFGRDDRPIEPWEERFAPLVVPLMILLSAALVVLLAALVGVCFLGWAIVSPLLPRSWRVNWHAVGALDPSVHADCPECRAQMALGPVDKDGRVLMGQEPELATPTQAATCPQCQRVYQRFAMGKVWSSWQNQAPQAKCGQLVLRSATAFSRHSSL